ncbi:hypothetical protein OROHE_010729 [Orobanche hederae]
MEVLCEEPQLLYSVSMIPQAAMNTEGKVGWEEIVDPRLDGKFDVGELNEVATLAHKCINRVARRRPSMRDIVLVLSRILKPRRSKRHRNDSSTPRGDDVIVNMDQLEHRRVESLDSMADSLDD